FLASDAMQGRGSGTQFELLAGHYIASQLQQYGIEPAGDAGATAGRKSFIQTVALTRQAFADAPALTFHAAAGGGERRLTHGREMLVTRVTAARSQGALQKLRADERPAAGAFVLLTQNEGSGARQLYVQASAMLRQGAAAVIVAENETLRRNWAAMGGKPPELPLMTGDNAGSMIVLDTDAFRELQATADGTQITLDGTLAPARTTYTWNVIGVLPGSDAKLASEAVLLSAHMDHIGVGTGQAGDQIYNGADDDASGVVAVLELARALAAQNARPKRTVYFVLFGSEEHGGYGAQYFLSRPPVALAQMVANLEFEMIGRPDPKVAADTLWLTGYERSNLGAELARQGARLVPDPHPSENFFQRSDNYALARRGVVAHTVSSFGLHPQYHKPDDDIAHIDFAHMTRAINSMVAPVRWLVNSNFTPAWVEGKKP
ncbi:MAG TPA: M20/M25/M40 family metallo-hydrolase, partial [Pyrinomonadaceae bacterium]